MTPRRVPALIPIADVARAAEWSTRRTRSVCRRAGVLVRSGRWWLVSRSMLRERLPDLFEDVFAFFELAERTR